MDKLQFQSEILNMLDASFENDRLFHSYILSGARNSGQLEIAKYFATKVIKDYNGGVHPNVHLITTDKQTISKEQVLQMNYEMNSTSLFEGCKVFIVDDASKLTPSAQNSLLKIIEEPNTVCYVFFIVENTSQLLTTIISRSQIIKFKPLPYSIIYHDVESNYEDKLKLKYSIYIDNNNFDEVYNSNYIDTYIEVCHNYINNVISSKGNAYLLEELFYSKVSEKNSVIDVLRLLIANFESIVMFKITGEELFDQAFLKYASEVSVEQLTNLLDMLFESLEKIISNANVKLVIDKLTIEGS